MKCPCQSVYTGAESLSPVTQFQMSADVAMRLGSAPMRKDTASLTGKAGNSQFISHMPCIDVTRQHSASAHCS